MTTGNSDIKALWEEEKKLFDFKKYEPKNKIISLELKSKKTRTTLNNVATDLINECKKVLGLQ
jgi:hypothetical protein